MFVIGFEKRVGFWFGLDGDGLGFGLEGGVVFGFASEGGDVLGLEVGDVLGLDGGEFLG